MSGTKPRSVREMVRASERESPEPATPVGEREAATLEYAGRRWEACVVGSTEVPRGRSAAPLLLVRFTPRPGGDGGREANPGADGALEAWVIGGTLSDVPEGRLLHALEHARPWSEDPPRRAFFEDVGGRRGR